MAASSSQARRAWRASPKEALGSSSPGRSRGDPAVGRPPPLAGSRRCWPGSRHPRSAAGGRPGRPGRRSRPCPGRGRRWGGRCAAEGAEGLPERRGTSKPTVAPSPVWRKWRPMTTPSAPLRGASSAPPVLPPAARRPAPAGSGRRMGQRVSSRAARTRRTTRRNAPGEGEGGRGGALAIAVDLDFFGPGLGHDAPCGVRDIIGLEAHREDDSSLVQAVLVLGLFFDTPWGRGPREPLRPADPRRRPPPGPAGIRPARPPRAPCNGDVHLGVGLLVLSGGGSTVPRRTTMENPPHRGPGP